MSQIQNRARELSAHLNDYVLDNDEIDEVDLLDSLASCGLTLVEDDTGEATLAYQDLLRPRPTS